MEKAIIKIIRIIDRLINFSVLTSMVLLFAFAGYALWDSKVIYQQADKANYELYKPSVVNQGKSFKELQALNQEVIAWLSVYGTSIDYPVTQSDNNMKYVNINAEGLYSLSGAIFLDANNNSDFSDFNNITYGHHMEKQKMFGEISSFVDSEMFFRHKYGNLYYDNQNYGIEFFAFVHVDAYDYQVFNAGITNETEKQYYLDNLLTIAINKRTIDITTTDRLILLSTCSSDSTNGRDILVGRITEKTYEDVFKTQADKENNSQNHETFSRVIAFLLYGIIPLSIIITVCLLIIYRRKKGKKHEAVA